jgi:serine/threonine protein kinase
MRLSQKDYLLSKDQSVEGATLESAVELLSSSAIPATAGFLYEFLMTYRSFTTPAGLFLLLKKRLTPEDIQGSDLALVRLRVVNIFKNWINHCPQDWETAELPSLFEGVLATAQEDAVLLKHLDPLRQLIAKIREQVSTSPRPAVPKISLPLYRVQNQLKIIRTTSAEVLAEQFTAIDIEIYSEVAPWDLILWSRLPDHDRESKCPDLYRLVDRYYEIGHFVATTIVSEPEMEDRIDCIEKFLDIARAANELGNFNLMMAIYSGITHPVLRKLKTTWENVPAERMKQLNSFIKYCDPEDNYDAMRTYVELTSTVRPCLPFLGGFIAEMSQIHTLSSDYLPSISSQGERLINYAKHRKLYTIISKIRRCNYKIAVKRKDSIISLIRRLHALPTDGLKMKVADLQEGSSYDILETEDSSSEQENGFEAVATPRYPVYDPRNPNAVEPLTDSSNHDIEYEEDKVSPKEKTQKLPSSKKKTKTDFLKSHSAGTLKDDGGTASSSGGDSIRLGPAGGAQTSKGSKNKTSSDGALNRKLMLRGSGDIPPTSPITSSAPGTANMASQVTGGNVSLDTGPTSPSNHHHGHYSAIHHSSVHQTTTGMVTSSSGPAIGSKFASASSNNTGPLSATARRVGSGTSVRSGPSSAGGALSDREGVVSHAAPSGAPRTITSGNTSRSSMKSTVTHVDSDLDEYNSDGPSPLMLAAPGSSYGSHTHLYHSGGGHMSTGTSPKDFMLHHTHNSVGGGGFGGFGPSHSSSSLNGTKGREPSSMAGGVAPSLLLPYLEVGPAESEDSPPSPTTTSSSPRNQQSGPTLQRHSSRNTNPSPIRKTTPSSYHSNPASARSSGKSSANHLISPAHSHDPWNPLHPQLSARTLATSPIPLPNHGSSGSLPIFGPNLGLNMSSNLSIGSGGNVASLTRGDSGKMAAVELKQDSKRYEVAIDLLETEEHFVHYLRILVEDAVYPLRQKLHKAAAATQAPSSQASTPRTPQSPHQIDETTALNEAHLRIIFSNIEALYSFHSLFLEDLHNVVRYWRSGGLGSLFSQYHHGFEAYVEYTNARHRGDLLLEHMLSVPTTTGQVDGGISACRAVQRQQEVVLSKTRKANLLSLLHLPVHRLPRILILLKEFKACTSEGHPDLPILADAISKLEHIAMKLPMTQEDAEQSMLQLQVLNKITSWKEKKRKLRPGRNFLGEFELKLLIQGTNRFPKLVVLLWSDVMFFCRTKESRTTRKKKWAILGILNLRHVHLTCLTAKEARSKFRDLSKETAKASGIEAKSQISWGKHPSVIELKYVGLEWLLSFQNTEVGDAFVREVNSATHSITNLAMTRLLFSQHSPGASESATIALIGSKVYTFGGSFRGQWRNELWTWDMDDRTWTKIQTSGEPPLARTEHTMCAVGKCLYLHGGQRFGSYIDDMLTFDTEQNVWKSVEISPNLMGLSGAVAQCPSPRSGHSLNAIGTKLYLFGGQWFETLHQRHLYNDLYCFDTETQTWTELVPAPGAFVPAPRQRHVAQVIDSKLVIFGGSGISSELSDLAIYDPATNVWRSCNEVYGYIPTNRSMAGSAVYGKKMVILGGACELRSGSSQNVMGSTSSSSSMETFNDMFVFDMEAMKWSHCWVPVELEARRAHNIVCNSADNALCIFGGRVVDAETGESGPTSEVLMLHGLSSIINNSTGRADQLEKLRARVDKLSQFAIQHQALLTVVGSHYVPPPSAEGVKWDPLTTKSTFSLLENLGSLVYTARHEPTQSLVAIKVLSHHDCSLEMLDIMAEEMQQLSRCRHPGLVAYHGFAPVSNELWIVSELCLGTSLNLIQHDILSEKQVSAILVTILESLAHLHSQNIVHKSIKSSNVLLNADGRIKLTDWGLSPIWKPFNVVSSSSLMAPELNISGGSEPLTHTAATDIYDLGLMVVGLLEPFGPGRQLRTRHKFSAEVLDFVSLCTASFAHRRPTAVELLSHPFILPQLQNVQRDDILRSLHGEAALRRVTKRTSSIGGAISDRVPLDSRKSSSGIGSANHASRRKSLKAEEIQLLRSTIETIKQEHAVEREKLTSQIMTLQSQNTNLESRLRAIELLVSNLVIPNPQ